MQGELTGKIGAIDGVSLKFLTDGELIVLDRDTSKHHRVLTISVTDWTWAAVKTEIKGADSPEFYYLRRPAPVQRLWSHDQIPPEDIEISNGALYVRGPFEIKVRSRTRFQPPQAVRTLWEAVRCGRWRHSD